MRERWIAGTSPGRIPVGGRLSVYPVVSAAYSGPEKRGRPVGQTRQAWMAIIRAWGGWPPHEQVAFRQEGA